MFYRKQLCLFVISIVLLLASTSRGNSEDIDYRSTHKGRLTSSNMDLTSIKVASTYPPFILELRNEDEKIREDLTKQLELDHIRINELEVSTNTNEKSISTYINIVAYFSGAILAVVTLILGFGAYRNWLEHKHADEKFKELERWLVDKKASCEINLDQLAEKHEFDLDVHQQFLCLRSLIMQGSLDREEVYPLLTVICSNPNMMYKPLFNKIIDLDIHPEITAKAKEGLSSVNK